MMFIMLVAVLVLAAWISMDNNLNVIPFALLVVLGVSTVVVIDVGIAVQQSIELKSEYASMTEKGRALNEFKGKALVDAAQKSLVPVENRNQASSYIKERALWLSHAVDHNAKIRKCQLWITDVSYFAEYMLTGTRVFTEVEDAGKYIIDVSVLKGGN